MTFPGRNALLTLCLILLVALPAATEAPAGPYNVGYVIYDFPFVSPDGALQSLTTAVWYPTDAEPTPYTYGDGRATGLVSLDGPVSPAGRPFPLVVFSHGYGGGGTANLFLTKHLASWGFVVASPDYPDPDQMVRIRGGGTNTPILQYLRNALRLARTGLDFPFDDYAFRPAGLRTVIDQMLAQNADDTSALHGAIDPDRIAVAGHSLGTFTALSVAGLDPQWTDPRIRAVLALSGGVFMWPTQDFAQVSVPIMFMYGEREAGQRERIGLADVAALTQAAYDVCQPPKFMLEVKGGTHFTVGQRVDEERRAGGYASLPERQVAVINSYAAAFLRLYLRNDTSAAATLQQTDPMLTLYRHDM